MLRIRGIEKTLTRRRECGGFSLLETIVAVFVIGLVALISLRVMKTYSSYDRQARFLTERAQVLDYVANIIRNRQAWRNTVDGDSVLKTYLESTSGVTAGNMNLDIMDQDNNLFIDAAGTYLDLQVEPTDLSHARWHAKASWARGEEQTALVTVTITPVKAGNLETARARTVQTVNRSTESRCTVVTTPIIGDGGGNQYDHASAVCTAPYIRTAMGINPGCGAIGMRVQPDPDDDVTANCYQVSSPVTASCPAAALNGVCEVTCCVFD